MRFRNMICMQTIERRWTSTQKYDIGVRTWFLVSLITLLVCHAILVQMFSSVMDNNVQQTVPFPITKTDVSFQTGHERRNTDGNSSSTNYPSLTSVGNGKFHIFSVIAEQSSTDSRWLSIVFNGWQELDAMSTKYLCCYQFANGSVASRMAQFRQCCLASMAKQLTCDISDMIQPDLAGLVLANESCTTDAIFHQVVYRKRHEQPKFAIGAQIAYENKNPVELIEWMEYHLHFGANAVVIYPYYNLFPDAMKVLNYYADRGQIEMVPLPPIPFSGPGRNKSVRGVITNDDGQVTNFDTQQRLLGYKYYIIMDTDEYIVPGKNTHITNFAKLMEFLTEKYEDVATLQMRTEMHLFDWEKTNNKTDIQIGQYGYHSEPRKFAHKSLHVTDRIFPGTVRVHYAKTKMGYKSYVANPKDVVLKHYRYCKACWFRQLGDNIPECSLHFKKIRGHFMDKVAKLIAPRVRQVKQYLNLA